MTHRADWKEVRNEVYRELAELADATLPHTPGRPGDHLRLEAKVVDDQLLLSTAVIGREHLEALHLIIHEAAITMGVDLED